MSDYPSEWTWWPAYRDKVRALYAQAGRAADYPDEAMATAFTWTQRPAFDIGAGMDPEAAARKHLGDLARELGLTPPPPPQTRRLVRSGRWLRREDGTRFLWQGISGFGLLRRLADGPSGREDVQRFLDHCRVQERSIVRVFAMCSNLFGLHPDDGCAGLPLLCELAAERGLYVEAVALVDTASRPDINLSAHIEVLNGVALFTSNLLIEGGNELAPLHPTQRQEAYDLVRQFPRLACAYAQGSTHNGSDESDALAGGDYVPVHFDRSDGENGWRWVRHTKEGWNLSEATGKFVVNDEPNRDDFNYARHLALGALCRICGIGDTFHYTGGRYWHLLTSPEQGKLNARRLGWTLVGDLDLDDGVFKNAGWSDSPIKSFDTVKALRCYSRIAGDRGVTLVLGQTGDPGITWQHGWRAVDDFYNEGGTALLEIAR